MLRYGLMALIIVPIMLGLVGAILPALGYFPLLGGHGISAKPLMAFMALPGIEHSIFLSLFPGLLATAVSTLVALLLPGLLYGHPAFRMLGRYLSPILSVPHITVAVGILFLLQPSGWLLRLLSPALTGFEHPPIDYLFPDQMGLMLVLGLVTKEIPFLILMTLSALSQINTRPMLTLARTMGYGPMAAWVYVIIPPLWRRIKLPVLIVLVFSLSVVDMAVVLAPTTPPPLSVRVVTLYQDPDLSYRFVASIAALTQMLIVLVGAIMFFWVSAKLGHLMKHVAFRGYRFSAITSWPARTIKAIILVCGLSPMLMAVSGLIAAMLWSVAGRWRFPSAWPDALTAQYWGGAFTGFAEILQTTLMLGFISSLLGLVMVMGWLGLVSTASKTSSITSGEKNHWTELLLFLPIILPQTGFLFGIQIMLLWLHLDGSVLALVWTHMLFVVPYIWLALAPSWRAFNHDWLHLAGSLGASPFKRFMTIRMPIMIHPIMVSLALGFSVSAALYLPTVFAGNGQVVTLTVEAVTLAAGASRHQLGVATGFQMVLPLLVYIAAGMIANWRTRKYSFFS